MVIPAVLYFHGAASERDPGPPDELAAAAGVAVVRHVRPGYDGTPCATQSDLRAVADRAIDEAVALGHRSIIAVGWSGGGPYALAAGALGRTEVRAVGILGSWAPMTPPHSGLPLAVRAFMQLGARTPRRVLQTSLAITGRRTPGHVDDVFRVARPWGFRVTDVTEQVEVRAWHAIDDSAVPIEPWTDEPEVDLVRIDGDAHEPSADTWRDVLGWARRADDDATS